MAAVAAALATSWGARAEAQPDSTQFEVARDEDVLEDVSLPRSVEIERAFLSAVDWTFIHNIDDLPPDAREELFRVAGDEVVSPGESFSDTSQMHLVPWETQHLYTALTDAIGVIVWYSQQWGSLHVHALVFDRDIRDACEYDFADRLGHVITLVGDLHSWVSSTACAYKEAVVDQRGTVAE